MTIRVLHALVLLVTVRNVPILPLTTLTDPIKPRSVLLISFNDGNGYGSVDGNSGGYGAGSGGSNDGSGFGSVGGNGGGSDRVEVVVQAVNMVKMAAVMVMDGMVVAMVLVQAAGKGVGTAAMATAGAGAGALA